MPPEETAGAESPHVLVIEDDLSDQARIAGAFEDSGYLVDVASSREQALQKAAGKGYDAPTLDLLMGDSGGLDVLACIRADSRSSDAPVVAITLDALSGNAVFPIADVLGKPLRTDEVVVAMNRLGLSGRAVKVMIIDDDPAALELASFVLGAKGFVTAGASDAQSALHQMVLFRPHIVLMDVQMPEVDGLELTRSIRAEPSMCHVVVIALTAYAMKGDEQKILAAGCDGYLAKPLDVATFAASVRKYLPAEASDS